MYSLIKKWFIETSALLYKSIFGRRILSQLIDLVFKYYVSIIVGACTVDHLQEL